jgi:hypothetical protein
MGEDISPARLKRHLGPHGLGCLFFAYGIEPGAKKVGRAHLFRSSKLPETGRITPKTQCNDHPQLPDPIRMDRGMAILQGQRINHCLRQKSEWIQRVHAHMIKDTLGNQPRGHISPDFTTIEAPEPIAKRDKVQVAKALPKNTCGRPAKGEVHSPLEPSPLEQMLFELDTVCTTGTKKNAQRYRIRWTGYKTAAGHRRF